MKYEGEPQRRTRAKRSTPCRGFKSKSKTAPASGAEDCDTSSSSPSSSSSGSPRSVLATIVLEEHQSQETNNNASHSCHKHSKSYSSVSSVGRKLVENLADEVVEDFIASKLMLPPSVAVAPSPAQDAPRPSGAIPPTLPDQEDVPSNDLEATTTAEDVFRDLPNKGVAQEEVDDDLIDSAFEARDNNFKEKRAYFEQRSRSEVEERAEKIKSTARMKPTLESQQIGDGHGSTDTTVGMHEQHWSQSGPLRTTTDHPTGEGVFSTNKSLSRVNSGRSWILELKDTGQASSSATIPDDIAFEEEAPVNNERDNPPFFSGACVVRRVFRAESLAEEESESSDGSVISVEINSGPRDTNDDGQSSEHALEWYFSMTRKTANDSLTTDHHHQ